MTKCEDCDQEATTAKGCNLTHAKIGGEIFKRIPVNESDEEERGRCHDCSAMDKHYHHYGCDGELCPKCGGQMITCKCKHEELIRYKTKTLPALRVILEDG